MGSVYPIQAATRIETIGLTGASGVSVAGSATGGAYGSPATIGTTGFAYDGFKLVIQTSNGRRWRGTITANTNGTDEPIATDFCWDNNASSDGPGPAIDLPISVPSGATIKVKAAGGSSGSGNFRAYILGYQGDGNLQNGFTSAFSLTDFAAGTSGCDPANLITLSGTTTTGWVQMQASTPAAIAQLSLAVNTVGQAITSGDELLLELGYGPSGSELATGIKLGQTCISGDGTMGLLQTVPYFIPAGTRLAARATLSAADTTHTVGLMGWGFAR